MRTKLMALLVIATIASGCGGSRSRVRTVAPPPMIGQAKTGAERVRLNQMHMMAAEDGATRR